MNVSLRPLTAEDMPDLPGGDTEYDDFGPQSPVTDVPGATLADDGGRLAVIADDELAGFVSWHWNSWGPNNESRNPNIGIWLIPGARGRGVGARAQRQLADLFFLHTAVNRVDALTDAENLAEQRALERAGFTREGVIRGAQFRLGAYHDMMYYAVLRDVS